MPRYGDMEKLEPLKALWYIEYEQGISRIVNVPRLEDGSEIGVLNRSQSINDFALQTENLDFFFPWKLLLKDTNRNTRGSYVGLWKITWQSMNNALLVGSTRGDDPISRLLM